MNFILNGCMYSSVALEYQKQSFYLMAFVQSLLLLKHCPYIHLYTLHCTRIYELQLFIPCIN